MKKNLLTMMLCCLPLLAWAQNIFTAKTVEGVDMTFKVISESEKTCMVGDEKGERIPIEQIACTVLPPVAACCLEIVFPGVGLMGIAWAVALQLNQHIIQIDSMRRLQTLSEPMQ